MREIISHIIESNVNVKKIHTFCANQVPPTVICHHTTLFKHIVRFRSTGIFPNQDDGGIYIDCLKPIPSRNLHNLNDF